MSEQHPELRWAPIPPKPKNRGRVWVIVGLAAAALVIVAVVLFLLIPRESSPTPTATPTPTPTTSDSASASPTPSSPATPSPSAPATPPTQPEQTAPPVEDPTVPAFRDHVGGWLSDAQRGLDIVASAGGEDALPVVDTLQQDAQRLFDAVPPSSIADSWLASVDAYAQTLDDLRAAITSGASIDAPLDAARGGAQDLADLIDL